MLLDCLGDLGVRLLEDGQELGQHLGLLRDHGGQLGELRVVPDLGELWGDGDGASASARRRGAARCRRSATGGGRGRRGVFPEDRFRDAAHQVLDSTVRIPESSSEALLNLRALEAHVAELRNGGLCAFTSHGSGRRLVRRNTTCLRSRRRCRRRRRLSCRRRCSRGLGLGDHDDDKLPRLDADRLHRVFVLQDPARVDQLLSIRRELRPDGGDELLQVLDLCLGLRLDLEVVALERLDSDLQGHCEEGRSLDGRGAGARDFRV
mmetsp:Transcript_103919/g.298619  ORF Transcript_103919/g.298619 Transcript_103919/m.298619 type:complete len:264 (+) Transcript_103919:519-1310(+)